jgi:hypothetical protein
METVSLAYGRGLSPFDLSSVLQGLTSGQNVIISSAQISDLTVNNAQIANVSASKITTGTLAIGQNINTGTQGSANIQLNTTGITGANASNIVTFQLNTNGSGQLGYSGSPTGVISWDSSGNVNIASSLITIVGVVKIGGSLIVCDGSGIATSITAGAVVLNSSGLQMFNGSALQTVALNSDGSGWFGSSGAFSWDVNGNVNMNAANVNGTLSAATISGDKILGGTMSGVTITQANGNVVIGVNGIIISGEETLTFVYNGSTYGYLGASSATLLLAATNGAQLSLYSAGVTGISSIGQITLSSTAGTAVQYALIIPVGNNMYV